MPGVASLGNTWTQREQVRAQIARHSRASRCIDLVRSKRVTLL